MYAPKLACCALGFFAAGTMLAGCGGSQSPIAAPEAMPRSGAVGTQMDRGGSQATEQAKSEISQLSSVADKGFYTLFPFDGQDGAVPTGLLASKGVLYGLSKTGGASNTGAVFSLTTSGKERVIYSFGSGTDGQSPVGALVFANGTFYGDYCDGRC